MDAGRFAWVTRIVATVMLFIGFLTGLKFLVGTLLFLYRVYQLISASTTEDRVSISVISSGPGLRPESGRDDSEDISGEEAPESAWKKWSAFVKVSLVYLAVTSISLSSVFAVWRNLRGLFTLFEVALPDSFLRAVDFASTCTPSDYTWDFKDSWGSRTVGSSVKNFSLATCRWDAAELAVNHFAENASAKTVIVSYDAAGVADGKPRIAPSRIGLGFGQQGGSASATLSDYGSENDHVFTLSSEEEGGEPAYYKTLTFTFVRDDGIMYKKSGRLGAVNVNIAVAAFVVIALSACFYFYFCFHKSTAKRIMREYQNVRTNAGQSTFKKVHKRVYPDDSAEDNGSFQSRKGSQQKPSSSIDDGHQMAHETPKMFGEANRKPIKVAREALLSTVGSAKAVEKAKKIKKEAAVASSPTIPSKAVASCLAVRIFDSTTGLETTLTGFACTIRGVGPLEVAPVQVILCPATHALIANDSLAPNFACSVRIPTDEGERIVAIEYYRQWTYSLGKFSDTCTAFLYKAGGLKMFKSPLTHSLNPRTVNQGLLYSVHTRNVSGGTLQLDEEGFVVHQIATKPGDSGTFIWSTVLTEARTAITVPVAIHVGNNGANVAVPVAVALRDVNFQ